jgi:hypothetical protein
MRDEVDDGTNSQTQHPTGASMHRLVAAAIALSLMAGVTPATAQSGAKRPPANLNTYSLRYWPQNSLQRGQTVSANTPYGVLTCTSIGTDLRRQCSLR